MENYFHMKMDRRAVNQISALGLAHCGDAVFELLVRSYLCASGRASNGNLHRATVELVCAPAQAERMERMLPLLTEEEHAKATWLECLFGALYLSSQLDRLNELFNLTMEEPHAI